MRRRSRRGAALKNLVQNGCLIPPSRACIDQRQLTRQKPEPSLFDEADRFNHIFEPGSGRTSWRWLSVFPRDCKCYRIKRTTERGGAGRARTPGIRAQRSVASNRRSAGFDFASRSARRERGCELCRLAVEGLRLSGTRNGHMPPFVSASLVAQERAINVGRTDRAMRRQIRLNHAKHHPRVPQRRRCRI
jgi:hypothetical protein